MTNNTDAILTDLNFSSKRYLVPQATNIKLNLGHLVDNNFLISQFGTDTF